MLQWAYLCSFTSFFNLSQLIQLDAFFESVYTIIRCICLGRLCLRLTTTEFKYSIDLFKTKIRKKILQIENKLSSSVEILNMYSVQLKSSKMYTTNLFVVCTVWGSGKGRVFLYFLPLTTSLTAKQPFLYFANFNTNTLLIPLAKKKALVKPSFTIIHRKKRLEIGRW